jgi:hypothetical protein
MLSAILVGMIGIQLLAGAEIISLSHNSMKLGAVLVGGASQLFILLVFVWFERKNV